MYIDARFRSTNTQHPPLTRSRYYDPKPLAKFSTNGQTISTMYVLACYSPSSKQSLSPCQKAPIPISDVKDTSEKPIQMGSTHTYALYTCDVADFNDNGYFVCNTSNTPAPQGTQLQTDSLLARVPLLVLQQHRRRLPRRHQARLPPERTRHASSRGRVSQHQRPRQRQRRVRVAFPQRQRHC